MNKKITAVMLLFALLTALFAGCGEKNAAMMDPVLYPPSGGGALTAALDLKAMSALTGLSAEECVPSLLHTDDGDAYRSLLAGENRLIFVTSAPDEAILQAAEKEGVTLESTPVARDALVFYVNAENPIKSLTIPDLARIYSGEVTDWRALSGDNCPIEAYHSVEDDFYTKMLSEKVMDGKMPLGGPGEAFLSFADDPLLYDLSGERADERPAAFRNTAGAIAYGSRFLLAGSEKERGIRLLSLNGAPPTAENLASGRYSLTYNILAVTLSSAAPESTERQVVSWLLSRDGKNAIKEAGYAPVE